MLWVQWLAHRFGLQWDMQTLGCEQSRRDVSEDTLAPGETFPGPQIGKGFSNQPVCICLVPHWHFSGNDLAVLAAEVVSGTGAPQLCTVRDACCRLQRRGGCSNPTARKVLRFMCLSCMADFANPRNLPSGFPRNSPNPFCSNPLTIWEAR